MIRIALVIITCLILPFILAAQENQSDNLILWDQDLRLGWADFMGEPDASSEYMALTHWRLSYDFKISLINGNASIAGSKVRTYFSRGDSWSKSTSSSVQLLQHEQGHFDLAEVYARKFRKELVGYKFKSGEYQQEIEAIFNKILAECDKAQVKYDKETEHGIIEADQVRWDENIKEDLEELGEFALSE